MRTLIVAGTWNLDGGKKSGLIEKIYNLLKEDDFFEIDYYNGGYYNDLINLSRKANNYGVIFWMVNVPNNLPKVENVKKVNPIALVIGSKRNHYNYNLNKMEYSFVEILNKSLIQRNNLTIEFSKLKDSTNFKMNLFDPLGTSWYEGYDLEPFIEILKDRIKFILGTRRERTYFKEGQYFIPDYEDYFKYVREVSEIFHKTIQHADGVTRFLGNASFRKNDKIYVSRRDVDKAFINKENFVKVFLDNDKVYYYGNNKPSKDTVVQVRLYEIFPNINFIIHSHCYAEGGKFTKTPVPCGALDELDEILDVVKKDYNNKFDLNYYKFNLKGHGCIIFGNSLEDLKQTKYITRYLPEKLN